MKENTVHLNKNGEKQTIIYILSTGKNIDQVEKLRLDRICTSA